MPNSQKESILGQGNTRRFDLFPNKIDDISYDLSNFIERNYENKS